LVAALEELGPTFSKIGQILSTRPDLLPAEFIDELSKLRDHVTPLTEEQVVRVMEQDLGVPWEDVFETIEPRPLAAGTIAQVHRASLKDGAKVVVKVQRPDARELIEQDLALLKFFAESVGGRPTIRQRIDIPAVFAHLSSSLHQELDFRLEAKNAERLRDTLAEFPRLAVPVVYTDLSTRRLLVMEDVNGVAPADVPQEPIRRETARQFLESFYKQILIDGFFHADPHPGNLMWQPAGGRMYFLDLGMVGEVAAETRELMILLLMALWQNDMAFVTEITLMLSGPLDRSHLDMEAFKQDIHALMEKFRGASIKEIQLGPLLQAMIEVSFRHGVPLPASLTLTAKALAQMQLAAAQLDPSIDPFEVAGTFLTRSLVRRMVGTDDTKTLFYESHKLKFRAMRAFESVEQLAATRPGQKLDGDLRGSSFEETVRRAGIRLSLGLIAAVAILASAETASSGRLGSWLPVTFGVTGAVFAVALVADLLRRPRKQPRTTSLSVNGEQKRA
jgi:predicted unusual protein kinase regulating ubiquinone biosynthesis (AarF/ABC1/UbiB family)